MLIIDYIDLIGPYPAPKDWEKAAEIYNALKALALSYNIKVLINQEETRTMKTKATASVNVEKIEVKKVVEERRVSLNISVNEAETLMAILESIGGSSQESRRMHAMHADSMQKALEDAGISAGRAHESMEDKKRNSLYFADERGEGWK